MKIHFRHAFDCTPEEVWAILDDPAFEAILEQRSQVRRVETSREDRGDIVGTIHSCTSLHELPGFVARVLGTHQLVYDQHSTYDRQQSTLEWRIVPRVIADRIRAEGVTRIYVEDGRAIREVHGDIEIRVRLVGARLESFLKSRVEKSYEEAATAMRQYLENRP